MNRASIQLYLKKQKYALLLLLGGVVGMTASIALTIEKIRLLNNPELIPTCSLNPIITCASAMDSAQSVTFGVSNTVVGLVLYAALLIVAISLLMGKVYSRRLLQLIAAVALAGFLFANYLILQSVLVLHVICPWCFTIWITVPLILYASVMLYRPWKHAATFTVFWYAGLLVLLGVAFRDYWVTLL